VALPPSIPAGTAAAASARSSRDTQAMRPSPAGPAITPSAEIQCGNRSREARPQEGERDGPGADALLGGVVVAGVGEGRVGGRAEERQVDDLAHARLGRGVHRAQVLGHALRPLVARHQEQGPDPASAARIAAPS
jgi:hypothetical protein